MIEHEQIQAALSARLDGEQGLLDDAVVDAHVAECDECRRFWERSVALSQQLKRAEGGGELVPPDLSEVILAGVSDPWRKMAQRRMVTLAVGQVALVAMAVVWAVWAVRILVGPAAAEPAATSFAAVRFGVALALGLCAWRPRQIPGVLLVVGTMFTFTAGFALRDAVLSAGEYPMGLVIVPLLTLVALVWTWVADRGIEVRRAWSLLSADPAS